MELWNATAQLRIPSPVSAAPREKLDPAVYTPVRRVKNGFFDKVLLQGPDGRFLFKPDQSKENGDGGVGFHHVEGRKALAYARLAELLGVDTPEIRLAEYEGRTGSLQRWLECPTIAELRYGIAAEEFRHISRDLRFRVSQERISIAARVACITDYDAHSDRNTLVDTRDNHLVAIDNDLSFAPLARIGTAPVSNAQMRLLARLKGSPKRLDDGFDGLLTPAEISATHQRIARLFDWGSTRT